MELSKRDIYALACIIELSKSPCEYVQTAEIASAQSIPKAYCQKILFRLAKAGLIESVKGKGFVLNQSAEMIKVMDVIVAMKENNLFKVGTGEFGKYEQLLSGIIVAILSDLSVSGLMNYKGEIAKKAA